MDPKDHRESCLLVGNLSISSNHIVIHNCLIEFDHDIKAAIVMFLRHIGIE